MIDDYEIWTHDMFGDFKYVGCLTSRTKGEVEEHKKDNPHLIVVKDRGVFIRFLRMQAARLFKTNPAKRGK